jgi:aspartate aminotransferase
VFSHNFEHIIIVNGFSKSQALTGWRIGYLIADEQIAKAATGLLSHIMGNAALPSQHAALAALERLDTPSNLGQLKKQRQLVHKGLAAIPKIKHLLPGGAFYVFIDVREITKNSADWCERLLIDTGVALVPGEAFGAPGFARLSFVADEQVLRSALINIKAFVAKGNNK